MQRLLELPTGSNVLMTAFHAVNAKQHGTSTVQGAQLVEAYSNHFTAPIFSCCCKHERRLERFSLVDPNVQTVVCSTTETAS